MVIEESIEVEQYIDFQFVCTYCKYTFDDLYKLVPKNEWVEPEYKPHRMLPNNITIHEIKK